MDVQATATAAVFTPTIYTQQATSSSTSGATPAGYIPPAPSVPVVSGSDSGSGSSSSYSGSSSSGSTSNPAIGETPGLATLPAGPPDGSKKSASDASLASGIAKLYNAAEQNVAVSFQVEQNPNEIVTVFTDKTTGKVIVQFPSETLIALAKFFDKLDGTVVNKKV